MLENKPIKTYLSTAFKLSLDLMNSKRLPLSPIWTALKMSRLRFNVYLISLLHDKSIGVDSFLKYKQSLVYFALAKIFAPDSINSLTIITSGKFAAKCKGVKPFLNF